MSSLPGSLQRALDAVKEQGEASYREIARILKVKPNTARRYLDQLVRLGYLEKLEGGIYRIAGKEEKVEESTGEEQFFEEEYNELRKPVHGMVEPLFFYYRGTIVPLRVSTIEQLFAVVKYRLLSPEELDYAIKTGYLQAWVARIAKDENLAREIDAISGLAPEEAYHSLLNILEKYLG